MLKAQFATQCTSPQGLTGSFLYDPATGGPKEAALLSPVFADSLDLFRFLEARGWKRDPQAGMSAYVRDDAPVLVAVKDLRKGDRLDLEGDSCADPKRENITLRFESVVVDSLTVETPGCTLVDCGDYACGFAPDHEVKVVGFEPLMIEDVTGEPATLLINGVALA